MARTIVYEGPEQQLHYRALMEQIPERDRVRKARKTRDQARKKAARREPAPGGAQANPARADDYLSKIAKYVPAEMVTLTALGFTAFNWTGRVVWLVVGGGAVLNCIYLLGVSFTQSPKVPPPPVFFYVLSIGAFFLWSMAALDPVAREAGMTGDAAAAQKTFVLALAAFILPALDTIFSRIRVAVEVRKET